MNIDLGRARILRNVDYVMGTFWFCLGAYLAYVGYPTIACFYMCCGPFVVINAWTTYSVKELVEGSNDVINRLKNENDSLRKIIDDYNNEEEYVE